MDYAQTAARYLKEDGVFVVCFAANDERAIPALAAANLHCRLRQDVVFRADLPPTISIFVAQRQPTPCVHASLSACAPVHMRARVMRRARSAGRAALSRHGHRTRHFFGDAGKLLFFTG